MTDGVEEPEAAFDREVEAMSPYDPRAEALARARGMSEDEIAAVKAGLEDIKAGRVKPSSQVFAELGAEVWLVKQNGRCAPKPSLATT